MRAALTPHDPMNADQDDAKLADLCFNGLSSNSPDVSPALDDLSLLPPTYIETGATDILRGDAEALHAMGLAAGADVQLRIDPDLIHMGQLWAPWWGVATASWTGSPGISPRPPANSEKPFLLKFYSTANSED